MKRQLKCLRTWNCFLLPSCFRQLFFGQTRRSASFVFKTSQRASNAIAIHFQFFLLSFIYKFLSRLNFSYMFRSFNSIQFSNRYSHPNQTETSCVKPHTFSPPSPSSPPKKIINCKRINKQDINEFEKEEPGSPWRAYDSTYLASRIIPAI